MYAAGILQNQPKNFFSDQIVIARSLTLAPSQIPFAEAHRLRYRT